MHFVYVYLHVSLPRSYALTCTHTHTHPGGVGRYIVWKGILMFSISIVDSMAPRKQAANNRESMAEKFKSIISGIRKE